MSVTLELLLIKSEGRMGNRKSNYMHVCVWLCPSREKESHRQIDTQKMHKDIDLVHQHDIMIIGKL